jgi:hypothetical protein
VLTVGVDVGGTNIRAGVVDAEGGVQDTARVPTPRTEAALEAALAGVVAQLADRHPVGAVGLALAGFITPDRRSVRFAPHLSWRDAPVADRIADRVRLPVVVEHDVNAAALAEVLTMAARMGLDPDLVGEVVNSGTGRSHASEFFLPRILRGRFADGYPMAKAYKDLVSGAGVSAERGIPMPVLAAATATYQAALLRGHGDKDKGGMVRVFEELLSMEYRSRSSQT